jgi:hypothetical protein
MYDRDMKNAEGYSDPTAYGALSNIESEQRATRLIGVLKYVIRNSGFELVGRIQIRDKRTGREFK